MISFQCPVPRQSLAASAWERASASVLAAMMKSLRCSPLILWVYQVTVVLPTRSELPGDGLPPLPARRDVS